MITFTTIDSTYAECVRIASNLTPISTWKLHPAGIALDTHKANYGRATKEGEILINPAFIGTTAVNKLKETMYHEIAHLIVGLNDNHNKNFNALKVPYVEI